MRAVTAHPCSIFLMYDWNEIRTAATVARLGTISAAAKVLGVHRATVTRHIDALEHALGAKLFQRHARGFTATELGQELQRIADATEAQFGELRRMARGTKADLSGEVTVTSLDVLVPVILPLLRGFQTRYPALTLRMVTSDKVLRLEYGEADMAFRIGPKPADPDNVVLRLGMLQMGLYAAPSYVAAHGLPEGPDSFRAHRFVGPDSAAPATPWGDWLASEIAEESVVFRSSAVWTLWQAVRSGLGIGFHPASAAADQGLEPVLPACPDWAEPIWAVTHVDLHRTAKVQALVDVVRAARS